MHGGIQIEPVYHREKQIDLNVMLKMYQISDWLWLVYRLFWTDVKFLTIQMLWLNKIKINKDLWDFLKYHSVLTINIMGKREYALCSHDEALFSELKWLWYTNM